jgi:tRNA pseudouridine55 synthase
MPKVPVHGILNLNKPQDRTSFSVIGQLRRLSRVRQIGHTGTLDPFASGVLPVTFGHACKISRFVSDSSKVYEATIELGVATDSYDRDGKVVARKSPAGVTLSKLEKALNSFKGEQDQVPPVFSAIKVRGAHSYKIARAGETVLHAPRSINITRMELLDFNLPMIRIKVECSKGTYIRSLAHDLGEKLGCGAYVKDLVRTRCGVFKLEDSFTLEQMEEAFKAGDWEKHVRPADSALTDWDRVELDEESLKKMIDGLGISIDHEPVAEGEYLRAYDPSGRMRAIIRFSSRHGDWRHEKFLMY